MYKRIISLTVMALMVLTLAAEGVCSGESDTEAAYRMEPLQEKLALMTSEDIENNLAKFSDMKAHWSRIQVGRLVGLEIIAGNGDGTFKPDGKLQADQFIKMLVCALGFKTETGTKSGTKYWAQPYIDVALKYGLVKSGEIADYTEPISREVMAKILIRAVLQFENAPDSKYDDYEIGKIKDYSTIADSCKQSVIEAYELGLLNGSYGKFNPKSTLTRAEAASVIIRLLDKKERKPVLPGPGEIIKLTDNKYNPIEIYPGKIPETFYVANAAQDAIPKAKGYVDFFYNPNNGMIFAWLYKDKESHDQSVLNMVASLEIAYNSEETFVYNLWVNDVGMYRLLFVDYMHEIYKTIFYRDANKAITMHDKYMNMNYTRIDGDNQYDIVSLNSRQTTFIKYPNSLFSVKIKLIGQK